MFLNLVSQSAFYLLYLDPFTFIDMLSVYIIFCLPFILVFVVVVVVSVVFFLPFHGLFENFQNSILSILFSSTSLCITTFYLQLQLLYGYNFSYLLLTFYQFKLSEESLTPLCVCVCVCVCLVTQSCPTLQPHRLQPARLLCSWNSPGKNTGVGSHSLLQGIFLTWAGSPNLSLLHYRWILYHLSTREVLMSLYCPSFIIILNIFSAYIQSQIKQYYNIASITNNLENWKGGKIYFYIEIRLIYNVVLASGGQQSDSVIHTHTHTLLFYILSIIGYYQAIQQVVVDCILHIVACIL